MLTITPSPLLSKPKLLYVGVQAAAGDLLRSTFNSQCHLLENEHYMEYMLADPICLFVNVQHGLDGQVQSCNQHLQIASIDAVRFCDACSGAVFGRD